MRTGTLSRVVTVAMLVVVVVFAVERVFDVHVPDGGIWPLRILVLVAAVVIAGIAYQRWSAGEFQAPRPLGAMIASLIGGASLASAVTSAPDGTVMGTGALAGVAVVALAFGVIVMDIDFRAERG